MSTGPVQILDMCKRHDDRMNPFAMDFDDKEENKEMTNDNDSRVRVPEV